MSHEFQIAALIILTIVNGIVIYVWIKALRNMDKKKNSFWSDGTEDEKPYTSVKDWIADIKNLIWPTIILIALLIISLVLISILTS